MRHASRILIVEDENLLAENLKTYLHRKTPDIRIVSDGHDAIAICDAFRPEVMVLDYGLPDMDGLETYSKIVRHYKDKIGCVLITGYPRESLAQSASEQGIRHLLCKPFGLSELQQLVDLSLQETTGDLAATPYCGEEKRSHARQAIP